MPLSNHPDYQPKEGCSCGSDKARFDFIPDTIYGIRIVGSCCRHDDRFTRGGDMADFDQANREFLGNMLVEIEEYHDNPPKRSDYDTWKWYMVQKSRWVMTPIFLARRRALKYYEAVCGFGKKSFNFHEGEPHGIG